MARCSPCDITGPSSHLLGAYDHWCRCSAIQGAQGLGHEPASKVPQSTWVFFLRADRPWVLVWLPSKRPWVPRSPLLLVTIRPLSAPDCCRLPFNRRQLPFNPRWLPFNRRRLPFNRRRLPFNRRRLPFNRRRLPFNRRRLPFNRRRLPFNRRRLPFNRRRLPFNRRRLPFNRRRLPFNRRRLPFNRRRLPFNRRRLPFNRRRLPFNRRRLPFNRRRLPFKRHRLPFNCCRLPLNQQFSPPFSSEESHRNALPLLQFWVQKEKEVFSLRRNRLKKFVGTAAFAHSTKPITAEDVWKEYMPSMIPRCCPPPCRPGVAFRDGKRLVSFC